MKNYSQGVPPLWPQPKEGETIVVERDSMLRRPDELVDHLITLMRNAADTRESITLKILHEQMAKDIMTFGIGIQLGGIRVDPKDLFAVPLSGATSGATAEVMPAKPVDIMAETRKMLNEPTPNMD